MYQMVWICQFGCIATALGVCCHHLGHVLIDGCVYSTRLYCAVMRYLFLVQGYGNGYM